MDKDQLLIAIRDMFDKKVEEVKQHSGVLFEDLTKQVKTIAEGHIILNAKMDRLETKVDKIESKVDKLEMRVDKLETKVDKLGADMSIVKDYVISVDK